MVHPMRGRFFLLLLIAGAPAAYGQGVIQPLGAQGIEQRDLMSVRARGMGTVFAAIPGQVESVVLNPASLAAVERPAFSASGFWRTGDWAETQHWNPNRYYAGLSLYFADPEDYTTEPFASPDWTHRQNALQLAAVGGAMPFLLFGRRIVVGAMLHNAAHLGNYDRNDNVLDPYIGQFRPEPVERPKPGEEIEVKWAAFNRERSGHMRAATLAAGMELSSSLQVGFRVSQLWGRSTDRQEIRTRGFFLLREDAHDYSYVDQDPADAMLWNGHSDYSGFSVAFGLQWHFNALSAGILYELPHTITRSFVQNGDLSTVVPDFFSVEGDDDITVPARIVAGVAIRPTSRLTLALDYFRQDYSALKVDTTPETFLDNFPPLKVGDTAPDWGLTHGVSLGMEWALSERTWVRAGFRRDPQPFHVEGSGLLGETAVGDGFSAGFAQQLSILMLNVSYEYQRLQYQDRWESNVDYNRIRKHNVLVGLNYSF